MAITKSNRVISAPSSFARANYLYVQEVGSLQSIEPHLSKRDNLASYLFFIVSKGSGYLFYRGIRHSIHTGDCIFIDCKEEYAHESSKEDPWELSWVHFYGMTADTLYKSYMEQGNSFLFHPSDLTLFLEKLEFLYINQKNQPPYMELTCHKYLTDLFYLCFTEKKNSETIYEKVIQVQNYIDNHFQEKLNLDTLAEHFFVSKYHLSREFKRIIGLTIGNYILGRRISNAKQLLRFSSLSLEDIGPKCGFLDTGYFIKTFKKYENMTPAQYRKKW